MTAQVPVAQLGTVDYVTAVVVLVLAVPITFGALAIVLQYVRKVRRGYQGRLLRWHVVTVAASLSGTWLTLALGQLAILGILDTPRAARLLGYAMFGVGSAASMLLIGLSLTKASAQSEATGGHVAFSPGSQVEHDYLDLCERPADEDPR